MTISKVLKAKLGRSQTQTESALYVSILCIQTVIISANNLLSLHQKKKKKKKKTKVGERPCFFPKGSKCLN